MTFSISRGLAAFVSTSALVLAVATVQEARAAGTVILRDDFNGSTLNTTVWGVGTWKLGRTQLGNNPVITGGMARLPFSNYRLTGCEIYSKQNFALGTGVEFEARVRLNSLPKGLVTSLFTYNTQSSLSDELDIEILTKQVAASTGGAPVLFTTWNNWNEASPTYGDGVHHASQTLFLAGLDVNQFHTWVIRWLPGRTEWLLDGVLVASSTQAQPDLATPIRLNFWAPASSWTDAYDSSLKTVNNKKQAKTWYYDVDWVEVRRLP
jgi:beta-glucanase (GH16 family)